MAEVLESASRALKGEDRLLLRGSEVMELTGYSRGKVYAMAAAGSIPCLRQGRSVRFPLRALMRWIEANTEGGGDR